MRKSKKATKRNPGPNPEHLRANGVDWKDALKHALQKPKPEHWPEPIKKGQRVKHREGHTGTAITKEHNGAVLVKQDDGAVSTWAAGDTEPIK